MSGWIGDHWQLADALLAAGVCVFLLIHVPYSGHSITARVPWSFLGDLAAYASLALRRRYPIPVLVLVWGLWLASGRWDVWTEFNGTWAELGTPTALMYTLYTAANWSGSRWSQVVLAATLAPALVALAQAAGVETPAFVPPPNPPQSYPLSFLLCAGVWGVGRALRIQRAAAESARENHAQAVLAEERVRIARELHDIVAHNVSAMVIQSAAASAALRSRDEAEAAVALKAIGSLGTTALDELRMLLGVLRDAPVDSRPGIEAITDLADRLPLDVRLNIEPPPREIPEEAALTAYRIVQEALTNTLKHAGKDATATVQLSYTDKGLAVEVADDGGRNRPDRPRLPGAGHGLAGIRERAETLGGVVEAAPLRPRGFRVRALVPWT
ncbi:sensor histidine kinase [Bailinhaonella thermotolerans]|uniref:sensor histidine kinase n=1 Tax=Bailinhaonella thermotolerans TaxID=1070861 RepID=UPI001A8E838B|nr:histidine kinase [Bailinhaonella thermotolerans]